MSPATGPVPWSACVSVYGDGHVLDANLLPSPALKQAARVIVQEGFAKVVRAYNEALEESPSDVVVFLHPDVYLPGCWADQLQASLAWLEANDPEWGVLGLVGSNSSGELVGATYSSGRAGVIGKPLSSPRPARTVDEFVFIVRRSSGLRFDEALPGDQGQLCATDICLQAASRGLGVHVIPAFAMHNSNGWRSLPLGFWKPYLYIRKKWKSELPIRLPYANITRSTMPMVKNSIRRVFQGRNGYRVGSRVDDIEPVYDSLRSSIRTMFGFETGPSGTPRDPGEPTPTESEGG